MTAEELKAILADPGVWPEKSDADDAIDCISPCTLSSGRVLYRVTIWSHCKAQESPMGLTFTKKAARSAAQRSRSRSGPQEDRRRHVPHEGGRRQGCRPAGSGQGRGPPRRRRTLQPFKVAVQRRQARSRSSTARSTPTAFSKSRASTSTRSRSARVGRASSAPARSTRPRRARCARTATSRASSGS